MQQVLIIRHGETEWNAERRWQGWLDAPLTPRGIEQAAARGTRLARDGFKPRVLYSSDLGRAARTAEILAAHLEVPVVTDFGFRERNGGDWQGHTGDEIEQHWPGVLDSFRHGRIDRAPGGESDTEMLTRFDAALLRALAHVGTGQLGIVTHGGILHAVAVRAGVDVHSSTPNLGGYWFEVVDGGLCNAIAVDTIHDDDERPAIE